MAGLVFDVLDHAVSSSTFSFGQGGSSKGLDVVLFFAGPGPNVHVRALLSIFINWIRE